MHEYCPNTSVTTIIESLNCRTAMSGCVDAKYKAQHNWGKENKNYTSTNMNN